MNPKISVIIINYRTPDMTANCVKSIFKNTSDVSFEVFVIDNSDSPIEYRKLADSLSKYNVRIIDAKGNKGFAKANNIGAKESSGKYLFFLNSDTVLVTNALFYLSETLDKNPECGIVGGNLLDGNFHPLYSFQKEKVTLSSAKRRNSLFFILLRNVFRKKDFNYSKKNLVIHGFVSGADLMIRKTEFEQVGGFDERFFMYGEDALLCAKYISMRHGLIFIDPRSRIIHLEGGSDSQTYSDFKVNNATNGNSLFYETVFGQPAAKKYLLFMSRVYKRNARLARFFRPQMKESFLKMSASFKNKANSLKIINK